MRRAARSSALLVAALALGACHSERRFITPPEGGAFQLAIAADTPAFFESMDLTVYLVETRAELPVRAPSDADLAALATPDGRMHPFPRRPWVERGAYELEISWVLSSLSTNRETVTLTINGVNEFNEYVPGINVVDDDFIIDFAQWERTFLLEPGQRLTGTIREEELDEVAVDLATVVNGAPNANQIVYFMNHSDHHALSRQYIPGVIPALVALRVGLRAESEGGTGPPVALEFVITARDTHDRLVSAGEQAWMLPVPTPFTPVVMLEP